MKKQNPAHFPLHTHTNSSIRCTQKPMDAESLLMSNKVKTIDHFASTVI